jgi:hypothetical protein
MQLANVGTTFFALFALIIGSSSLSYGQSKNVSTQVSTSRTAKKEIKKPVEAEPPPFSILVTGSHSVSLYDYQDGTRKETNDFEFMPSYQWLGNVTSLYGTFSQDVRDSEKTDIGDLNLIQKIRPFDFSRIKLIPAVTAVLPEAKESRELYNLEGAFAAKLTAAIQEKLLIPGFSFAVAGSFARNAHRYETAMDGSQNSQYTSRQSVYSGYEYKLLTINVEFHHINKWTYAGGMKESFEHTEEVGVNAGDHYNFALGHTNAGTALKANARDSNIQLVDDNNSLVYAKVSMKY